MTAQHIADLIDLVAESTLKGDIGIEYSSVLNAELWKLAMDLGVREDVNDIIQSRSEDEMAEVTESLFV